MKLLFGIKRLNSAAGGAENVLCALCSELARRGHEVVVVSFDKSGDAPFFPLDSRVRRIEMGIGDSSRRAQFIETVRRIIALRKLVLEEKPQVAIGFMHSMFVPLAFSLAGTSIPVVGSEHIVAQHYKNRPLQLVLLIISSFLIKNITVLSESIQSRYPSVIRKRMVAINNPVALATGQANLAAVKDRYFVLNVGRLDAQKDQATLIRAFGRIATRHPNWNLKIIGDGPLREDLLELINSLCLNKRVEILGVRSNIGAEYAAADVFVVSSRYESFGLVTAESMSYGLPSIGFADCPGTNELIQDGVTGFLVSAANDRAASLASKLELIISDPQLRETMGNAGRHAIKSKYSINRVASLWEDLLGNCYG